MFISEQKRLLLIVRIIALAFLSGILISLPLWLSDRSFPTAPLLPLPALSHLLSVSLLCCLALSILLFFLFPLKKLLCILLISFALLEIIFDLDRCQPWVYQYLLMLFLFLFYDPEKKNELQTKVLLNGFRVLLCGIYFWSGVQKINPGYFADVAPWITEPLANYFGITFAHTASKAAYIIPFLEMGIALGLLFGSTRKIFVIIAIIMHVYIIFLISPLGKDSNYVILPWNILMIALLSLLFRNIKETPARVIFSCIRNRSVLAVFILVWILPVLSFFGKWDDYLSSSLYAGNSNKAYIYISHDTKNKLTLPLKEKVRIQIPASKPDTLYYIFVNEWAQQELWAPVYPEEWVFRKATEELQKFADDPSEVNLVIEHKFTWIKERYYENVK